MITSARKVPGGLEESEATPPRWEHDQPLDSMCSKEKGVTPTRDSTMKLSERESEIIARQLHVPEVKVSFLRLYQYGTTIDFVILAVSTFCAVVAGAILPIMFVFSL